MKKWLFTFTFLVIQTTVQANSLLCTDVFQKNQSSLKVNSFEASTSMSQKIRDNAHDYWAYTKNLNNYPLLKKLSSHQGIVVGDNHGGNFIFSLFNNQMKYFLADIKNSGIGSFIVDFNMLALITHASIKKDFDVKASVVSKKLLDHYLMGLEGKARPTYSLLEARLQTKPEDYLNNYNQYVSNKYKKNKKVFKLKPGSLESLDSVEIQKQLATQVLELFPQSQILDYAIRPKERGGSKFLQRYWVLMQTQGKVDIIEFKEIGEPATSQGGRNQNNDHKQRYEMVMDVFWGERDPFYSVVTIDQKYFETRRKKVDVISVPYKQTSLAEVEYLLEIASLSAYQTGLYHSRTAQNLNEYRTTIQSNISELTKEMKELNKEYRSHLKAEIEAGRLTVQALDTLDMGGF